MGERADIGSALQDVADGRRFESMEAHVEKSRRCVESKGNTI